MSIELKQFHMPRTTGGRVDEAVAAAVACPLEHDPPMRVEAAVHDVLCAQGLRSKDAMDGRSRGSR